VKKGNLSVAGIFNDPGQGAFGGDLCRRIIGMKPAPRPRRRENGSFEHQGTMCGEPNPAQAVAAIRGSSGRWIGMWAVPSVTRSYLFAHRFQILEVFD